MDLIYLGEHQTIHLAPLGVLHWWFCLKSLYWIQCVLVILLLIRMMRSNACHLYVFMFYQYFVFIYLVLLLLI